MIANGFAAAAGRAACEDDRQNRQHARRDRRDEPTLRGRCRSERAFARKRREQVVKRELRRVGGPRELRLARAWSRPCRSSPACAACAAASAARRLGIAGPVCASPACWPCCGRLFFSSVACASASRCAALGGGRFSASAVRDLGERAELLAGAVDQLRRARRVALGRREERDADLERQLERCVDELRRVLLVPVPA